MIWEIDPNIQRTVYEYDRVRSALNHKIDPETGEILLDSDPAVAGYLFALDNYQQQLEGQEETIAKICRNLESDAEAISQAIQELQKRKKAVKEREETTKELLDSLLGGNPLTTGSVACRYRNVKSVDLSDNFVQWAEKNGHEDLLTQKEPVANKNKVRDFLKAGNECPEAEIVTRRSLSIK